MEVFAWYGSGLFGSSMVVAQSGEQGEYFFASLATFSLALFLTIATITPGQQFSL